MSRKGVLFVISGPSGVGKGTIKNALLPKMKDISESISVTTRPPRSGELNGKEYFFITQDKFVEMINNHEFLEHANVYGNMYGTPYKYVVDNLCKGYDILLEIDIQGAMQVKEKAPEGVFIFIIPPDINELAKRLSGRGKDTEESIGTRLAKCEEEMTYISHYDYAVVNDDLDEAVAKVQSIIMAERCRINKNMIKR